MLRQARESGATPCVSAGTARSWHLFGVRTARLGGGGSPYLRRALARFGLLMRLGPLLQAVAAVALGFPAYRQPSLGVAAVCVAFAWSIWLTLRTWTVTRYPPRLWWTDALVAMAILVAVSTTI